MIAAQSNTVKAADGSYMSVVDLNAAHDPISGQDAAARIRFMNVADENQLVPGKHYLVTLAECDPPLISTADVAPVTEAPIAEVAPVTAEAAPAPIDEPVPDPAPAVEAVTA